MEALIKVHYSSSVILIYTKLLLALGQGGENINKHKAALTNYKLNPDPFTPEVPKHSIIIVTYHIIYIFQKMECHILWNVNFQQNKKKHSFQTTCILPQQYKI